MKNILLSFSLLVLAQLLWAVSWVIVKKLYDSINPILLYTIEAILIGIIMLPVVLYFFNDAKNIKSSAWVLLVVGSMLVAVASTIYYIGFKEVSLSVASLSSLIFPLFAVLLGVIFFHEHLTWKFFVSAILMVAGFLVLVL